MNKIDVFLDELTNSIIQKDDLRNISFGFAGTLETVLSRWVSSDKIYDAIMSFLKKAGLTKRIVLGWLDSKPGRWTAERLIDEFNKNPKQLLAALTSPSEELINRISADVNDFTDSLTDRDVEDLAERWIPEVWQEFEDAGNINESANIRVNVARLLGENTKKPVRKTAKKEDVSTIINFLYDMKDEIEGCCAEVQQIILKKLRSGADKDTRELADRIDSEVGTIDKLMSELGERLEKNLTNTNY